MTSDSEKENELLGQKVEPSLAPFGGGFWFDTHAGLEATRR